MMYYSFAALCFIILMYAIFAKLTKKMTHRSLQIPGFKNHKIKVFNVSYIDNFNRLVRIVDEDVEYLVLVGKNNNLLLDKIHRNDDEKN